MKKNMLRTMAGVMAIAIGIGILPAQTTAPATMPAAAASPTTQSALPKDLTTAIQNGIDLFKAGKDKEAIVALVNPDDLAKDKSNGNFDKMVGDFVASGHAKDLLASLQNALIQAPDNIGPDFISFARLGENPPLVFRHVKNGWYIR